MAHAEERLAKYERLEGGIRFIDSIPKNASGKILKNALSEQAARELSATLYKHFLIPWERFVNIGRMRPNLSYGRAID